MAARRLAFHLTDRNLSFAAVRSTPSLSAGHWLSDTGDSVILNRLERNESLVELALKLRARRKARKSWPAALHFALAHRGFDARPREFARRGSAAGFDEDEESPQHATKEASISHLKSGRFGSGWHICGGFRWGSWRQIRCVRQRAALRCARAGLDWISSTDASIGRGVRRRKIRAGLRRGSGHSGRSIHSALRSRKKVLTIRSSSEWKLMTAKRGAVPTGHRWLPVRVSGRQVRHLRRCEGLERSAWPDGVLLSVGPPRLRLPRGQRLCGRDGPRGGGDARAMCIARGSSPCSRKMRANSAGLAVFTRSAAVCGFLRLIRMSRGPFFIRAKPRLAVST